jgi:hypothetical protein
MGYNGNIIISDQEWEILTSHDTSQYTWSR